MHSKKYISFIIVLLLILQSSCKKFAEVPSPADRIITSQVFADSVRATSAVTSIYGYMINGPLGFANSGTTINGGYSSGDLDNFNPSSSDLEVISGNISSTNANAQSLWTSMYQVIYFANACKEGLEKSRSISSTLRNQLIGETEFIRAFSYFHLVNFYGDVPLILSTDYHNSATLPRNSKASVYDQIITDLLDAKNRLSTNYPTAEKVRPNKWTASALLARVYLYLNRWQDAATESASIINSGSYTPLPILKSTFLKNSKDAIWQLTPTAGFVKEISYMIPSGSVKTPQIFLASSLLQSFETGDQRRTAWVDSVKYSGTWYYYPGKYKSSTATFTEYYMVLRIEEQYLIHAEAAAQLNQLQLAITDLNVIRARAGLTALASSLTQDQVLAAVEKERRSELFAEWAHRWFDLKRTNKAATFLPSIKPNWQLRDTLYPIPQNEILANPSLVQNPGY